jgi:hypothetical protein
MGTGPFTTEVSQVLKIRNGNHTPVAFKVGSSRLCRDGFRGILMRWASTGQDDCPENVCAIPC